MTETAPDLLTSTEVADLARVSIGTVNRWARERLLPAITLPGGQRRFRREDVAALLEPEAKVS